MLPTAQADAGSIERRGSCINRQSHTEATACSRGRASGGLACQRPQLRTASQAAVAPQPRASDGSGGGKGMRS
ncbi:hypothetical protein GW17_00045727 [Ensete ventricosum]|nr:hypothetical protein GW17_00045727 [Ensete ventricosum]